MKKKKLFSVVIFSLIAFMCLFSCEKHYDSDKIEDIRKIKELLLDSDCDKGISCKGTSYRNTSHATNLESYLWYCEDWIVNETNIDEIYMSLGHITSVIYNRNKMTVVIDCSKTGQFFSGEYTYTFYTKNKH
jgi:hypothetical protein